MAKKKWKKKERLEKEAEIKAVEKKGNNKALLIIGIAVLVLVGYTFLGPSSNGPVTPPVIGGSYELVSNKANTHTLGKITLVEFFDFYCSHCNNFRQNTWPVLDGRYGDKIELVDLVYPLRQSSFPAAEAYEIAKDLGRGEEMKDALFTAIHEEGKDPSNLDALISIATSVGLDETVFRDAFNSHSKQTIIEENRRLGNSYNLRGTPLFIIDGNIKALDPSAQNLQLIIDSILETE
jgi:thiol:disulfide interchange protein DsbA